METVDRSYNDRLQSKGIETIEKCGHKYLRYKNKTIRRPAARVVIERVKKEFNLEI